MREIKFRAWDKGKKVMLCPIKDSEGETWYITGEYGDVSFPFEIPRGYKFTGMPGDYILMQYTGLRDKNGVEIYEGDIVEYENGNAGYGRPRHEEISRDVIPNLCNHDEYFDDSSWWQTGWVIGNVHENPELLKGSVTTNEP